MFAARERSGQLLKGVPEFGPCDSAPCSTDDMVYRHPVEKVSVPVTVSAIAGSGAPAKFGCIVTQQHVLQDRSLMG